MTKSCEKDDRIILVELNCLCLCLVIDLYAMKFFVLILLHIITQYI
jgi:hypothetical protein